MDNSWTLSYHADDGSLMNSQIVEIRYLNSEDACRRILEAVGANLQPEIKIGWAVATGPNDEKKILFVEKSEIGDIIRKQYAKILAE